MHASATSVRQGSTRLHLKQMRRDTNLCWTLLVFCKDFASNQKFLSATSSTRRVFSAQECPVLVQTSICEVKCSGIALPVKLDDYRIQDRNKKNQTDVYNAHFIQKWSRLASHPNLSETTACQLNHVKTSKKGLVFWGQIFNLKAKVPGTLHGPHHDQRFTAKFSRRVLQRQTFLLDSDFHLVKLVETVFWWDTLGEIHNFHETVNVVQVFRTQCRQHMQLSYEIFITFQTLWHKLESVPGPKSTVEHSSLHKTFQTKHTTWSQGFELFTIKSQLKNVHSFTKNLLLNKFDKNIVSTKHYKSDPLVTAKSLCNSCICHHFIVAQQIGGIAQHSAILRCNLPGQNIMKSIVVES